MRGDPVTTAAHCVISLVTDTGDAGWPLNPACVVHTHWAPCPHDGAPASPAVLHTEHTPTAEGLWWDRTHGQRPLVMHHDLACGDHALGVADVTCWCQPVVLPATQTPAVAR